MGTLIEHLDEMPKNWVSYLHSRMMKYYEGTWHHPDLLVIHPEDEDFLKSILISLSYPDRGIARFEDLGSIMGLQIMKSEFGMSKGTALIGQCKHIQHRVEKNSQYEYHSIEASPFFEVQIIQFKKEE